MAEIELEVDTPERQVVADKVSEVQLPAKNGYMSVLPGHAPLLGLMGTGLLSYQTGSRRRYLAVQGGFIEVLPEKVRILANLAERAEDIDLEKARNELGRAQQQLAQPSDDSQTALDAVALAEARVEAGEHRQP
jgi:F-type H+-transporting ATPase subunit epsilon